MTDDALLNVFKSLKFNELLNQADKSTRSQQLIERHFMIGKYRVHENIIHLNKLYDGDDITGYFLWQYVSTEKFLRNFGHLITKLEFSSVSFTQQEIRLINQQIVQYCSESLKEISLVNVGFHLIGETGETFQNVVSVNVRYHEIADNLKLDRIYPHMERLKIVSRYPLNSNSLVRSYPHLKHFEITDWGTSAESQQIQQLLELNPQLESLRIDGFPELNVLIDASERLVNLTTLGLTLRSRNFRDANGHVIPLDATKTVHFECVRSFTVTIGWEAVESLDHAQITFKQLENLHILSSLSFDKVAKFIESNKHLKVLAIPNVDTTQLFSNVLEVLRGLSDLEEITLKWSKNIATANVLSLLTAFEKWNKITFVVSIKEKSNELFNIVPSEWQFESNNYDDIYKAHHLLFEREIL